MPQPYIIPWVPVKLNLTTLEVTLFIMSGVILYIILRYGKRIRRWWPDLRKRYRKPCQLLRGRKKQVDTSGCLSQPRLPLLRGERRGGAYAGE